MICLTFWINFLKYYLLMIRHWLRTVMIVMIWWINLIIIDNKLSFNSNLSKIRKSINVRLYSIQKLFYLPLAVKIQFIKTFILPYFDYCSTLCIYFSKLILQKILITYNNCIFKLIDTKDIKNTIIINSEDFNEWNKLLNYGLNAFQHPMIIRLAKKSSVVNIAPQT